MSFYADLHVHSKYARATSRDLDLEHMALWAAKKGVTVLGTGDFTHPAWFNEIREKLVPAEPGLFRLKPELERWCASRFPAFAQQPARFLLEVEISTIYKKGDRTRKVHHLHYVPDLATAERFIAKLARIGNLNADGRPILGLDSRHLLEITLEAGEGAYLIPAHIWTPWFAVLGSKSGFDSVEECYGDLTKNIFALETGLSSDPPMNWRLSQLDRYTLVSNSDAHSPGKIGREACKFDCEPSYWAIKRALETGHAYGGTVEFFPEEGKYHLDGHRACGVRLDPEETKKQGGLCPTCGKELTVGVMHRVGELADRGGGSKPQKASPFRSLVPLSEVLGEIHRAGAGSRKVADHYEKLVGSVGPELFILEQAPLDELRKAGSTLLAEGIARMREGRVIREAGYDGEYGVIRVFTDDELIQGNAVSLLFELPVGQPAETRGGPPHPDPFPENEKQVPDPARSLDAPLSWPTLTPAPPFTHGKGAGDVEGPLNLVFGETAPPLPLNFDPLAGLDPEQRAAASITDGQLLIIAGPGTGKTRTLTHRIAHLITNSGVIPEQILAVTFTNRAANEMRDRLRNLIPAAADRVLVTTFHGLGHLILREHGRRIGLPENFRVAGESERRALLCEKLLLSDREAGRWLKRISELKRVEAAALPEATPADDGAPGPADEDRLVLAAYEHAMLECAWLDFDDLIAVSTRIFDRRPDVLAHYRNRFRNVSVDEFQDIDARQYRLVRLLAPPDGNLCVIGDPDQSIYGFRGGEPLFFRQFATDYPAARTIVLRRNYRSGRAIVEGALQAIAPVSLVGGRVLESLHESAAKITIQESPTDRAEAEFIVRTIEKLVGGHGFFSLDSRRVEGGEARSDFSFRDFAVLYRTGAQVELLLEALARSGIPFRRHSHGPLIEHPMVRAMIEAARRVSVDESVRNRLKTAVEMLTCASGSRCSASSPDTNEIHEKPGDEMANGTVEATMRLQILATLEPLAAGCGNDFVSFESELALLSNADLWDARADCVSLLTLHASKGLEFAVVFIAGCEDGLLPFRFGSDGDANDAEERRLFFVGMTRARERLFLSHAKKRLWRGQIRSQNVSPFVAAIERGLLESSRTELKARIKPGAEQLGLFPD
ncbi:MAG TPA: UvrD-helicase domain-containing protein [Candidatus Angelobacter sp.]|nr:UvrD-helicase domain-containing protein [Candidatus Angelobacter sp.]